MDFFLEWFCLFVYFIEVFFNFCVLFVTWEIEIGGNGIVNIESKHPWDNENCLFSIKIYQYRFSLSLYSIK